MIPKAIKITSEKSQETFFIHEGITQEQIDQLVAFTKLENDLTRDIDRFGSRGLYEKWVEKGRTIYSITDREEDNGDLKGMFWIGEKPLPERLDYTETLDPNFYRFTYAIRVYDSARGKSLSQTVIDNCISEFLFGKTLPVGVWLETNKDNAISIHMLKKQGARIVSGPDRNNRIILVKEYQNTP